VIESHDHRVALLLDTQRRLEAENLKFQDEILSLKAFNQKLQKEKESLSRDFLAL
jgi:hypothetical protein